jgi:hypothetical protein
MESPPKISSLVLFGADSGLIPDSGAPLVDEGHEEGPAHMATELGDIHFAICQAEVEGRASARRAACSTFGGFHVAPARPRGARADLRRSDAAHRARANALELPHCR